MLDALQNPWLNGLTCLAVAQLSTKPKAGSTLQWTPAHCGVHGNETADRLAKRVVQLEQQDRLV